MKLSVALRLALLVVTLVAVIWASTAVRKGGVAGMFASLGVDLGDASSVNICPARVHALSWPDGSRIEERVEAGTDMKWLAHDAAGERPINYLQLEKWLSEHCLTRGDDVSASVGSKTFATILHIDYVNGTGADLAALAEDAAVFRWSGHTVRAPELHRGLDDLRTLAGWSAVSLTK